MKLFDEIKGFVKGIKDYLESEKELLKLHVVKRASDIIGNCVSVIFLIMMLQVVMATIGIWLGFWLSDITGSYPMGFGLSAVIFIVLLILTLVFRKALLVRPFVNMAIKTMIQEEKLPDEHKK